MKQNFIDSFSLSFRAYRSKIWFQKKTARDTYSWITGFFTSYKLLHKNPKIDEYLKSLIPRNA